MSQAAGGEPHRRTDNDNWAGPGGAVDLGELVARAAARETLEESGIECAITGIVGIYYTMDRRCASASTTSWHATSPR